MRRNILEDSNLKTKSFPALELAVSRVTKSPLSTGLFHWIANKATALIIKEKLKKKTPWPESASELYQPRDRRLSAKLLPTFADR
jgi:hypothetical protein